MYRLFMSVIVYFLNYLKITIDNFPRPLPPWGLKKCLPPFTKIVKLCALFNFQLEKSLSPLRQRWKFLVTSWAIMTSKTGKDLENIQYFFLHMVLDAQRTTPKVALLWETGILSMEGQVFKRKLRFINHLKRSEGSLANEIYKEQVANNWPGLSEEDDKICGKIGIPRITKN